MMGDKGKVSIETIIAAGNTAISDMVSKTAKWAACGTEIDARKFAYTMAGASETLHRMLEILTPLAVEEEADVVSAAANIEERASASQEPESEPEPDSESEEEGDDEIVERMQEAGNRKKLNLDLGKIRALRTAGWTIDKIAIELGVSATAIKARLSEMWLK